MSNVWGLDFTPSWEPPDMPAVEQAYSADCSVECRGGRWIVWLDVLLASGPVRKIVSVQYDERRALQAARIIERNVRRRIPGPHPPSLLSQQPPLRFDRDS